MSCGTVSALQTMYSSAVLFSLYICALFKVLIDFVLNLSHSRSLILKFGRKLRSSLMN